MNRELSANMPVSHYRIVSKIGAGGMGEVYLAQDTKLDRKVALKFLPSDVAADKQRMRRFTQEAKASAVLNDPNIAHIYEIGEHNGRAFIAMEFIDGLTLRERMTQDRMSSREVLDIATQVASALATAHKTGIAHRDIKPENVMLLRGGVVKILDFGLAKFTEEVARDSVDTNVPTRIPNNTEPGVVMGTAMYMSPEQARGLKVDNRTDIFSLGILIYEMTCGRLPFEGANTNEIIASLLNDKDPLPLVRHTRDVPPELERIVEKALRKDRDQRYQTMRDVHQDLRTLKQRLEFAAEVERSRLLESSGNPVTTETNASEEPKRAPSIPDNLWKSIKTHHRSLLITLAVLVIAGAAVLTYRFYFPRSAGPIDSIAVLPLANASNDPNTEYLSDGISEALINSLTELQQLRVIARTTAFQYKGKEVSPQAVGRDLNVRAVLMGRVRQFGDSLDVQVDLVDTTTGAQLWGEEYERKASDLISVKQTIAREVIDKLRLKLTGEQQQKLARRDTKNVEAYQFYLRGRYFQGKRTTDALEKAVEEFQQALDRDPNFALGYVGFADSYLLLEQIAGMPASEMLPKARAAVDRALAIDDSLSEAHTSSARIHEQSWRWSEAEEEYKRAISLNPNYPTAHQWFALYLRTRRRFDEAMIEIKRAQELDPLSPLINANVAFASLLKSDFDSLIEQDKKVVELDPGFWIAHSDMGWAYLKQRRSGEATAEFQKAVDSSHRSSLTLGNLGHCYAVIGQRTEALALVKELEERYARREAIGFFIATTYAGLGDKDQAFAWLEKDFQQRSGQLPFIVWWPNFDNLRSDQRYADLVRRMGLQP